VFGSLARAGVRFGLAALVLLAAGLSLRHAVADGDTRTLTMRHAHTGETITITYKRDGEYDEAALKKLDWFLRDWRRDEKVRMDPHLYDILWQAYRETGATQPIVIICGYRAPETNTMLRARSGGVAKFSQHVLGKAIDFLIPGVPLARLRAVGLKMQRGGVGFYPRSGSPFVHLDVGTVRHWPGISREQLVKIFPHGRTVHIPNDGKPLPGFAQALAEIERRGNAPNGRTLKLARAAGVITDHQVQVASLIAQRGQQRTVVAQAGSDEGDEGDETVGAPLVLASLRPPITDTPKQPRARAASAAPSPEDRPQPVTLASLESKPAAAPGTTASAADTASATASVFDRRFWPGPVQRDAAPATPFDVAGADLKATGSTDRDEALAYAADEQKAGRKPAPTPMGERLRARLGSPARADVFEQPLTMEAKSLLETPMAIGGQRLSSPWTRAAMLTPSVFRAMTVSQLSESDPRLLQDLLYKPTQAVMMTFADDPQGGMTAARFSGEAVVFVATTRFAPQRTASLR
jgi:uncharacterized protein YcbK (DUF882 family)